MLLQACGEVRPVDWNPQAYTVKRGDTLYSIAWRYEKDFQEIAKWNNIEPPYAIYPGQRLTMEPDGPDGTVGQDVVVTPEATESEPIIIDTEVLVGAVEEETPVIARSLDRPETINVKKGDTLYSIARQQNLSHQQLARWNALSKPYPIYPGQTLRLSPPQISSTDKAASAKPREVTNKPKVVVATKDKNDALPKTVKKWHWPVRGKLKVVSTFNAKDTARKGIKIAGNRGQDIKAAAEGKVVYSGNGLISYGNLIIIKHSNSFLSAYAHNKKLLVKEGQSVNAGETIAHMGTLDKGRAQLHFEIRKNGKPVNPLRYLPLKRG